MKSIDIKHQPRFTPRSSDILGIYLSDINKFSLLNKEEELDYTQRIKSGDQGALELLIKSNLRFVVAIAKRYQNFGLPLDDLISAGNEGLMKAAPRFDETRGFRFITYAVHWIQQSIWVELAAHAKLIRMPGFEFNLYVKIKNKSSVLEQELLRSPTMIEISESFGVDIMDIEKVLSIGDTPASIDAPFSGDDNESFTLIDTIDSLVKGPDEGEDCRSLLTEVTDALQILNERERNILCWSYGIGCDYPMSTESIALKLKISQERIRVLKRGALRKIQKSEFFAQLRKYL